MSRKSVIGAKTELQAAAYFMEQGYHVSRSIDPQCPFDLVLTNDKGESRLIDIKSLSLRKSDCYRCKKGTRINRSPSRVQKDMGIEVYVYGEEKQNS